MKKESGRKHDMRPKALAILVTIFTLGTGGALWRAEAAAPAAVTPKMQAPPEARSLSRAFSGVAKALRPSVVRLNVEVEQPRTARNDQRRRSEPDLRDFFERFFDFGEGQPFPQPGPGRGTGSGLIIDTQGNIITNNHVIDKATKVTVMLADGRELPAKVVGRDEWTDVAVVRLESPPAGLIAARLGDSDRVEIGEWVLAVGSPLGLDQTVTAGIVSSRGRVGRNPSIRMSGERVREYIQTDAKINPGNSGGPLVNLEGEVIGINTLINTGPGGAYGFAIPINQAKRVAESIVKSGRVRYAYLGVKVGDLQDSDQKNKVPASAPQKAAVVAEVTPGGPAAKAGVRAGDIITKIDNQPIESKNDVIDYVASREIGSRVTLGYMRDGRSGSLQVTLGELPADRDQIGRVEVRKEEVGVQLQDLTPEMARFLNLPANTKGAVVTEVVPGSRAAKAGLRDGDVVVEINRKAVRSAEEASAAFKASPRGALLRIRRGGAAQFITIPSN
jgi:serine protease Do